MSCEYGHTPASKIAGCHKVPRAGYEEWVATRVIKDTKKVGQTQ